MNYYEEKFSRDRANRIIGSGVSFVALSPAFGIIAGAFVASASVLYIVTALVAIVGLIGIAAGIYEKRALKKIYG